jgi:hypothetical protein
MVRLVASVLAALFGFISGVLRNSRTFHPDGRTFLGTVTPITADASDAKLARAAELLRGQVLMRIGMGIIKQHAPAWAKSKIPDAPSVATRFSPSTNAPPSFRERGEDELDILFTAGGDRLWKLLGNLATGGRCYGLHQFDYFRNRYFADVPYRIEACGLDVWLRLIPADWNDARGSDGPNTVEAREQGLTDAVARRAELIIAAQSTGNATADFRPFAKITFDREITDVDQEALRFQPTGLRRGFEPYGILTTLREKVYPASAHARPHERAEREFRERKGFFFRLFHRSGEDPTKSRASTWCTLVSWFGLLIAALVLLIVVYAAVRFLPNYAMTNPDENGKLSPAEIGEQRFKYGSTGGEASLGIPFPVWEVVPLLCAETLKDVMKDRVAPDFVARVRNYTPRPQGGPDEERLALSREGYKAFGIVYEKENGKEKDIPIGVSMRRNLGFDRVFVNCAFCHASTVRASAESEAKPVLGMPANLLDIHRFEDFLFRCTSGPQFTSDNLIPEIERTTGRLNPIDRYLIYPFATAIITQQVQFLSSRVGFFVKQPDWGPGRVDTFSNAKGIFNEPWTKFPDWHVDHWVEPDQVGTVDFPSIWYQEKRKKRADGCPMELHWDGNNDSVEERDLSAAFGTGALPSNIDHKNVEKLETWMKEEAKPPKFTKFFPDDLNDKLADEGKAVYNRLCADCHGANGENFEGKYVGFVTPIEKIKTDRYRLDNYTEGLAATQAMLYAGDKKSGSPLPEELAKCDPPPHGDAQENSYRFKRFHKTYGYANSPLDGVWLRAPYLHNGSVPTLRELLKPAKDRPKVYFRGNDEYDPQALGFKWDKPSRPDGTAYFRYDTSEPGNSNAGHEGPVYGTELTPHEKDALIEYLKTF